MKQILNWTCGAFFRAIGRFLFFVLIGGLFAFLISKSGIKMPSWLYPLTIVKADTLSYDLGEYRLKYYMGNTSTWIGPYNFGTSVDTTSYDYIEAVAVRLGTNSNFIASKEYLVSIELGALPTTNALNNNYLSPTNFSCYGSTSLTSWNQDSSKVENCEYIGAQRVGQTSHLKYLYKIRMTEDIKGIQINIYFPTSPPYGIESFRIYKATKITYGEDISGAIDEQTIIIQNEINNLEQTIIDNNQTLIDTINENSVVCNQNTINKDNVKQKGCSLNSSGYVSCTSSNSNFAISDYYSINENSVILGFRNFTSGYSAFYDENYGFISSFVNRTTNATGTSISIPSNAKYVRFSINYKQSYDFFSVKTCSTGNQAINDNFNSFKNTFNDTNTDEDTGSLNTFFHDFNLSIEGPISQIVLLPVNLLNTLIVDYNSSSSHPDLCTTFKGKEICLPSGDILWKHTLCNNDNVWGFGCTDVTPLRTFFQLVIGGYIVYTLLRRLVNAVEKGLDPQSTRVDMMKL